MSAEYEVQITVYKDECAIGKFDALGSTVNEALFAACTDLEMEMDES